MREKALLLLSGGIDSPVAGDLMARRGLVILAVHFSLEPITDNAAAVKSRRLAEKLGLSRLFVVIVGPAFAEIAKACDRRLYFVLSKRLMIRIAEAIARREGCAYLVTGESLGQVSSQTLQNLRAIDAASTMVVLRPLIGFDKEETVRVAREIGVPRGGPPRGDAARRRPARAGGARRRPGGKVDIRAGRLNPLRMTYYLLKPCRTATAFISTLKHPRRVALEEAADRLKAAGLAVTDFKVMLLVEGDPELTFYESGKILVKTDSEAAARTAIDRVYDVLGLVDRLAPSATA